jgi:esterase FrsA
VGSTTSFVVSLATTLALILPLSLSCFSQQRAERTLDEIKTEAIHRAENGMYPLIGLDPADVKEAFNSILAIKTNGRRHLWVWPIAT